MGGDHQQAVIFRFGCDDLYGAPDEHFGGDAVHRRLQGFRQEDYLVFEEADGFGELLRWLGVREIKKSGLNDGVNVEQG